MIKKVVIALMLALPLSMAAQKFGVCNADEILQALPDFAEAQAKLKTTSDGLNQEMERLQKEIETKYTEFQNLDPNTPDAIKQRRMQEIQEADQRIQEFRQNASQDIQREQMRLMQPMQQKIMEAIKTVGQTGGYTIIFPTEIPYYIDAATVVDVTPDIKKVLNIKDTVTPAAQ